MEKFFKGVMMTLGFIIAICLTALFAKCAYKEYFGEKPSYEDCIQQPQQPIVFTSIEEVMDTHGFMYMEREYEDTFLDIPPAIVQRIATEILQTRKTCTIKDISELFRERYRPGFVVNEKQLQDEKSPQNTGVPLPQPITRINESSNQSQTLNNDTCHGSN